MTIQQMIVVDEGNWGSFPILRDIPVHFLAPFAGGRSILVSVDGQGNHLKSDPYPRMRGIRDSRVMARSPLGLGSLIFVDVDGEGNYIAAEYPLAGGPFPSIEQLIGAACVALRRPSPFGDPPPSEDGPPSVYALQEPDASSMRHNTTLEDLAYELEDLVQYEIFCEKYVQYYHFNFTTKTKRADHFDCGMDKLFFAEVKCRLLAGPEELVVGCFRMIDPIDDGHCYGCPNDMKHPNKADAYAGGHVHANGLFYRRVIEWSDSDEDEKAKETRIRRMFADQRSCQRSRYATGRIHWGGGQKKA